MGAVSLTKCQWGRELCDTIGFSDRRDLHNTLDPRSPSTRLENKASKSQLLTLRPSRLESIVPYGQSKMKMPRNAKTFKK